MSQPTDNRPVLIYDADCVFCRDWARRGRRKLRGRVEFKSIEEAREAGMPVKDIAAGGEMQEAVLIEPDGRRSGGADAIFRLFRYNPRHRWVWRLYRAVPLLRVSARWMYPIIARWRHRLSALLYRR
jgi:predicted DCC family thiol-disulfide oxidoreductase YuxK